MPNHSLNKVSYYNLNPSIRSQIINEVEIVLKKPYFASIKEKTEASDA